MIPAVVLLDMVIASTDPVLLAETYIPNAGEYDLEVDAWIVTDRVTSGFILTYQVEDGPRVPCVQETTMPDARRFFATCPITVDGPNERTGISWVLTPPIIGPGVWLPDIDDSGTIGWLVTNLAEAAGPRRGWVLVVRTLEQVADEREESAIDFKRFEIKNRGAGLNLSGTGHTLGVVLVRATLAAWGRG